jgi:nickel-dependent lactate racemase
MKLMPVEVIKRLRLANLKLLRGMRMKLAYGSETININFETFNLSPDPTVTQKIVTDQQGKNVSNALKAPLSDYTLAKWLTDKPKKLVIVISDITRNCGTSIYLNELVNALERLGVMPNQAMIVVANGNHRRCTEAELLRLVGANIFAKYRVENHNSDENLVDFGMTPAGNRIMINQHIAAADKVLLTGNITYHNFAGFSGGRKSVLPGVSGRETILYNHRLMLDGDHMHQCCRLGIIDGNPIHQDMVNAVKLLDPDETKIYGLNVVTNLYGQIIAAFCGRIAEVFAAGVKVTQEKYKIETGAPGDIVLCSAGGYPYDINFYQSFKSLYASSMITADGGNLFIIAECRDGLGESYEKFQFWFSRNQSEIICELARNFDVVGQIAYWTKHAINRCKVLVVTAEKNLAELSSLGIPAISRQELDSYLVIPPPSREKVTPVIYTLPYGNITYVKLV